ncbi:hypothetical protein LIER_24742 [Lithospermum erythrorhizon]|uniref:Uncharacterized protein n=1 Tax=Lithospermum erythrorhizon TaxID=34254 RepID=A0AAV3R3T1_LITER
MPFSSSSSSPKSSTSNGPSNLMSFLHSVTPNVPICTLPKSCLQDLNSSWLPVDGDTVEYFTLQDFFECYEEWSVFGVGAPLLLNNEEEVVQYFIPYLSAVQIFTIKPFSDARSSQGSTGETDSEIQSRGHSESDKHSRSSSNDSNQNWDVKSTDSSIDHEGVSYPMKDRLGHLYFQYSETGSPFWRVPLADKVADLSETYPGICDLKSIDLSPASWMSVAWYPIYHIPMKGSMKDLTTCFLTYHTLSSFVQGETGADYTGKHMVFPNENLQRQGEPVNNGRHKVSVPPFGLASHRMQGDVWLNGDSCDFEKIIDLYNAADSWLKQVGFSHPDFEFFSSHSPMSLSLA